MELREKLEQYVAISLDLVTEIKEEANTEILMERRERLIEEMMTINISKEEKIKIGKEFSILEVEKLVGKALEEERKKVKDEIKAMHIKKQANKGYVKNINSLNFFNVKI